MSVERSHGSPSACHADAPMGDSLVGAPPSVGLSPARGSAEHFGPSPAVESVHRDDPYVARDGYRSPYVLEEEYAAHDLMLLDRRREHRPPACWEWSQAEWLAAGQPADRGPCKQCSRLYRGRCVRCPICGYWKRLL